MDSRKDKPEWRGKFGWLLLFLGAIERVVGWGGDIDFVLSRTEDPAWVGDLFAFLTTNIGLVFILAGVALIVWNERRLTEVLLERHLGRNPPSEIPAARPPAPIEAATQSQPPPEEEIWLGSNITPTFLVAQHEGKTSLEADGITDKYLGKWMRVTAYLYNATVIGADWLAVSLQYPRAITIIPGHDIQSPVDVDARFNDGFERLKVRRRGDVLTIEGKLERVSPVRIDLVECRLVRASTREEFRAAFPTPPQPQDTGPEKPQ